MAVNVQKREFMGWKNCIAASNGIIELIATTDVGPRIIHFGFAGGKNEFAEFPEQLGTTGGEKWKIYGGHRLWHSPEVEPKSSMIDNSLVETRAGYPDNGKIEWKKKKNGMLLSQPVEPWTLIKKEMEVSLAPDEAKATVVHRLLNDGAWPVELAVWALTVMAPGGKEIIPQVKRSTGFLPNRMVALWPYTKMNDPRVYWGEKYITVNQDPTANSRFKIGLPNEDGWAAYVNDGHLFVKKYQHFEDEIYPDYASSYETFTDGNAIELETLSPLVLLEPGDYIEHTETWYLYDNVKTPGDEKEIDEIILPFIK